MFQCFGCDAGANTATRTENEDSRLAELAGIVLKAHDLGVCDGCKCFLDTADVPKLVFMVLLTGALSHVSASADISSFWKASFGYSQY
jgi:hypothetical protein